MSLHDQIKEYYPQYSDIQRYPADKCACVRKTKDEWGILGNFYRTYIVIDGVTIDCTERLFHLMKFKATAEEGIKGEFAAKAGQNVKMHMRHIYKDHSDWLREDWGSIVVDAMRFCLQTKYEQCEAFRKELERSKGLFIVEDETERNRKRHKDADSWGTNLVGNEYVGPNLLGRLLMELRDTGKLEYHLPADAFTFISYLR